MLGFTTETSSTLGIGEYIGTEIATRFDERPLTTVLVEDVKALILKECQARSLAPKNVVENRKRWRWCTGARKRGWS